MQVALIRGRLGVFYRVKYIRVSPLLHFAKNPQPNLDCFAYQGYSYLSTFPTQVLA